MMCEILAHERIDKRIRTFLPKKLNVLFPYCFLFSADHSVHGRNLSYRSLLDSAHVLRPTLLSQTLGEQTRSRSLVPICGSFLVLKGLQFTNQGNRKPNQLQKTGKEKGNPGNGSPRKHQGSKRLKMRRGLVATFRRSHGSEQDSDQMGGRRQNSYANLGDLLIALAQLRGPCLLRQDWIGTFLDDIRCWRCWLALTLP